MSHCFTSVKADLQFMWSSRHCVLVCKLYKFYVICTVSSLANKNMYLKIDRKVQKEKDLHNGSAIWYHMSFSPRSPCSLLISLMYCLSCWSVGYKKAYLYLQPRNGFVFLMVLPKESLIYLCVPPESSSAGPREEGELLRWRGAAASPSRGLGAPGRGSPAGTGTSACPVVCTRSKIACYSL